MPSTAYHVSFTTPFSQPTSATRTQSTDSHTSPRQPSRQPSWQHPPLKLPLRPRAPSAEKPESTGKCPATRGAPCHSRSSSRSSGPIPLPISATVCAKAPFCKGGRDMPSQQNNLALGRISPATNGQSATRSPTPNGTTHLRLRSTSGAVLPSEKLVIPESASAVSLKGVTGSHKRVRSDPSDTHSPTHRHGKVFSPVKSPKPRIQVVIPTRHFREKPLPSVPFQTNTSSDHIVSAAAATATSATTVDMTYLVSPPVEYKDYVIRDSMVSPLSDQQPDSRFQPVDSAIANHAGTFFSPNLSGGNSSEEDVSSTYSDKTSMTSAEVDGPSPKHKSADMQRYSTRKSVLGAETGHPTAASARRPRVYPRHPPVEHDSEFKPSCSIRPVRNAPNTLRSHRATIPNPSTSRNHHASVRSHQEIATISQTLNPPSSKHLALNIPSPTLSQAANDLERQLTAFTEFTDYSPFAWDDVIVQKDSPLSPQGVPRRDSETCPPQLPRKSSRRQTPLDYEGFRLSRVPYDHIASQLKRRSTRKSKGLTISIPNAKHMTVDDFSLSPLPVPQKSNKNVITPDVAENVILSIMQALESLEDLFACAVINRGFYRVFKRYELELMQTVLYKMSPPAWEHREICYPGHDQLNEKDLDRPRQEYTPETYIQHYSLDMYIIAEIKVLIKDQCASFLRPEIAAAIVSDDEEECARVDDALWRIWTFCKIFGCGKGREDDIVAQMDWLKGGVLVHQQTSASSAPMWDDMNETLASAPECFAKGNEGGLTAEELFDVMELWNCLGVLLQPIEGRTNQAREYGVFENTDVRGGDIDGEELMLDEWYYYLLTNGLSTILDLAGPCGLDDASVFIMAEDNGLLSWKPPVFGGTRRNFLKEAAARVYEDKIAHTYAETSTKELQRAISKQRIQKHISALRQRRNCGEPIPEIRMSQDRPMSEWENVMTNLTRPRPQQVSDLVTHIPTLGSHLTSELSASVSEYLRKARTPPPPGSRLSAPRRIVAVPLLPTPPPSTVPSVRDRSSMASSMPPIDEHNPYRTQEIIPEMPRLQDHPMFRQLSQHARQPSGDSTGSSDSLESQPAFQQHPLQHAMNSTHNGENTAERAIHRIVEMGFTPEQAKQALRRTDLGDGLRVDRAVELLLRGGL